MSFYTQKIHPGAAFPSLKLATLNGDTVDGFYCAKSRFSVRSWHKPD